MDDGAVIETQVRTVSAGPDYGMPLRPPPLGRLDVHPYPESEDSLSSGFIDMASLGDRDSESSIPYHVEEVWGNVRERLRLAGLVGSAYSVGLDGETRDFGIQQIAAYRDRKWMHVQVEHPQYGNVELYLLDDDFTPEDMERAVGNLIFLDRDIRKTFGECISRPGPIVAVPSPLRVRSFNKDGVVYITSDSLVADRKKNKAGFAMLAHERLHQWLYSPVKKGWFPAIDEGLACYYAKRFNPESDLIWMWSEENLAIARRLGAEMVRKRTDLGWRVSPSAIVAEITGGGEELSVREYEFFYAVGFFLVDPLIRAIGGPKVIEFYKHLLASEIPPGQMREGAWDENLIVSALEATLHGSRLNVGWLVKELQRMLGLSLCSARYRGKV